MKRPEIVDLIWKSLWPSGPATPPDGPLEDKQSLPHDLGADSLDLLNVVMAFEEECGIQIDEDAAEKHFGPTSTVGGVVAYIEKMTGED